MNISIIVAMANNRVIGLNNRMPWHLSADLKRFKRITMGSPILMGRKTFESIGRPLPGRTNIIVTRNPDYRQDGCLIAHSIDAAIQTGCRIADEIFVIGGSELYKAVLGKTKTIHLTLIKKDFEGDTFFPDIHWDEWTEIERTDVVDDLTAGFDYSFIKLIRDHSDI
ncbi:MAG: dihydrofolate reductase [Gammaproteobacteria bacterium]